MRRLKTCGIVLASLALLSAAALLFGHHSDTPLPFNTEVWKQHEDTNERLRMVGDLKPKLVNSSKAEVERLLGTPRRDFDPLHPNDYYYLLGTQESFLDTDGIWLCLKFENDRVHDVQVFHD
jgi:hypothetical protein